MATQIKPEHIAIAGGAAIVAGVILSGRGGGTALAVTGPTESTSRELIRAGVEHAEIGSQERIAFEEIRASERVAIRQTVASENLARSFAANERLRTEVARELGLKELAREATQDVFDFLGSILKLFTFRF